jgi:hypothetical protein
MISSCLAGETQLYALICGLEVYLVEALNLVYLVLVQKLQLFQNGEVRDEL